MTTLITLGWGLFGTNGWLEKQLTIEGKEILLIVVAQEIHVYVMFMFKIPKGVCKKYYICYL